MPHTSPSAHSSVTTSGSDMIYDYIIIGAGSAGCVMAEALSRNPKHRVLLLEAGGSDRSFWIQTPIGYGKSFFDARVNWKYSADADSGLGGRKLYWPRGKVLGGSSSINAMVYCRGLGSDYDDWRDAGNSDWGYDQVVNSFHEIEDQITPERQTHDKAAAGSAPKLKISYRDHEYHPLKHAYYQAAAELNMPKVDNLNADDYQAGFAPYPINTFKGKRFSSADGFLYPAMGRKNLTVICHAKVDKILFEPDAQGQTTAKSVIWRGDFGQSSSASAQQEIILCAGAVNSPKLLQLSGLGAGDLLKRHGIDVVLDQPAIGRNLQDHLGINYYYKSHFPTLNQIFGTWQGRIRAGLEYILFGTGPLSLSVNQLGGMVKSDEGEARPNLQLYCNPMSYSKEMKGKRELLKPDPFPGFILSFNPCRPTSRGSIEIASPNSEDMPIIRPNSLSTDRDVQDVLGGAKFIAKLQKTQAMQAWIKQNNGFNPATANDQEILDDFKLRCGTVFHPCGTVKMAPADQGGVLDQALRVHKIKGLRVVDASAFPNITSANTHAPTVMLAHKVAKTMLAG